MIEATTSLRFVLLFHDWPAPHFDLMLERNGVLRTWRLPTTFEVSQATPVEALPDHRLVYLHYEGPLTGNRGSVRREDGGVLKWLQLEPQNVVFELFGTKLCGRFQIENGILQPCVAEESSLTQQGA